MTPSTVAGRRILITGSTGFVGVHLARALDHRGALVWGAGPEPRGTGADDSRYWPNLEVADFEGVRRMLEWGAPDAVVHLAAQSSAGRSFEHAIETYRANALGTMTLLEAARTAAPKARLLIVGTSEVYGPQPEGTRVGEETALRPISPYALSKAVADAAGEFYARMHGLDVVRTRSFGHIGPGQSDRFVVPSIARQIAEIETGGKEPVVRVGNLEVTRDLCDVRDVAEAYVALLEHGRAGAVYNVCRGEGQRLAEVVERLCARARRSLRLEVDPRRMRPADVPYLVGDPGAIRRDASWRPRRDLEGTLDEVLDEWRQRVAGNSL